MTTTTQSPPPVDGAQPPAPRPGVRLKAPGAAPLPPDENDPTETPLPEAPADPAAESPPAKPSRRRRVREVVDSAIAQPDSSGEPTTPETRSSRTSTEKPVAGPKLIDRGELEDDITSAIKGAGELANANYAPDGTPLYLVDEVEARGMAAPAARVIDRKLPGAIKDPDAQDAFAAGITLARYLWRQIRLYYEIKRPAKDETGDGDQEQPEA